MKGLFPRAPWLLVIGVLATMVAARPAAPRNIRVLLQGNEFRPSIVRAAPGDTIVFANGSGGPHNVAFERDSVDANARALLERAMGGEKIAPLAGPLMIDDETYTIVVPALPNGRYPLVCIPHQINMRGALIVTR